MSAGRDSSRPALAGVWLMACGASHAVVAPSPANGQLDSSSNVQHAIGPAQLPEPQGSAAAGTTCPTAPSVEAVCRAELEAFQPGCGPLDCSLETLASAHGVSVQLLKIDDQVCDGECSGATGILGQTLGVPSNDACEFSATQAATTMLVLVAWGNRLWRATRIEVAQSMWNSSVAEVYDVEIFDRANLAWTLYERSTASIEPDAGEGGEVITEERSRTFVWLDQSGPHVRDDVVLLDRREDNTYASRMPDESDAEYRVRRAEHEANAQAVEPSAPVAIPKFNELPGCESGECSSLCDLGRLKQ